MEVVYLLNGQACYLKEKVGNRFIVTPIYEYEGEEGEWFEEEGKEEMVVDAIYPKAPTEKFDAKIKQLQAEIDAKSKEALEIRNELWKSKSELSKTQIDKEKFIINRSEFLSAKELVLFIDRRIMPIRIDLSKGIRGLKIAYYLEVYNGEENYWGYTMYDNDRNSNGDKLCKKYGFLIDPTETEIEDTIHKRIAEITFDEYAVSVTDDKYLTPKMLEAKHLAIKLQTDREKARLEKELLKIQSELEKYKQS